MLEFLTPAHRRIALVALFISLFANFTFLGKLLEVYPPAQGNLLFVISVCAVFTLVTALLFNLLCHGRMGNWVLVVYLLASSLCAYFMAAYGTVIDQLMLENLLQTNVAEAGDLLSPGLFGYLFLLGVLPSALLIYKPPRVMLWKQELASKLKFSLLLIVGMVLLIAPFTSQYASYFREHKSLRFYANPTYPTYSAIRLAASKLGSVQQGPMETVANDASLTEPENEPTELVILVVGETARADRFSLNGYSRSTNPELSKEEVLSFTNVHSCGTSTAVSVPCMFSNSSRDNFTDNTITQFENALDVLKRVGVEVLWRDNNSDSKGVATRVAYENFRDPAINPVCDEECRDIGMLSGLKEYIEQRRGKDILIVLHQMGNHGPAYYKRYPLEFERFKPVCKTNELAKCSQEEISNGYDNAILYTDHFLAETIKLLKQFDGDFEPALLYLSDHGESLGEYGVYLHGAPYAFAPEEQTHVASLAWVGKQFEFPLSTVQVWRNYSFTHSDLFCSLLITYEVESSVCQNWLGKLIKSGSSGTKGAHTH